MYLEIVKNSPISNQVELMKFETNSQKKIVVNPETRFVKNLNNNLKKIL